MSNNFFRAVIEGMGEGVVVVDAEAVVLVANPAVRRLFGLPSDSAITEFAWPKEWHSAEGHKLDPSEYPLRRALQGTPCDQLDLVIRAPARDDVWVSVTAGAIALEDGSQGAVGVFRDVTRARHLETGVRKKEALYGTLARNLPGGAAFLFDTDLRILAAHGDRAMAEAGYNPEELIGKHVSEAVQPPNRESLEGLYRATIAGQSPSLETVLRDRAYSIHAVPVRDDDGVIVAGIALSYDVTEHKRDAAEMKAMSAKVSALMDHLSTGVLFADPSNRIQLVNRAFCRFFGFSGLSELVGCDSLDDRWIPAVRDREAFRRVCNLRMREGIMALADRLELTDGRILERDYVPVDVEGVVSGHFWCFRDVTERERARAQLAELSNRDDLTALYNRRGFITLAEQWLRIAARTRRTPLLLFVDVNGMKPVNDHLGHAQGDRVLRDTADLLRLTFRESDILARLGGDEFVVLAVDAMTEHSVLLCERLHRNVNALNDTAQRPYRVSLSVGVSAWDPAKPRSVEELLAEADARMYEAKRSRHSSSAIRVASGM